ncbi:DUF1289 domain-containing protein [Vibrio makurazakiensis]
MPTDLCKVNNPCIRNCCLDENDVCVGCFRTYQEIIGWGASSNELKAEIMRLCEIRRLSKTTNGL